MPETRKRYVQRHAADHDYVEALRARRRGEDVSEPEHVELAVVEVEAVQGDEVVTIRVTEDVADQYRQVLVEVGELDAATDEEDEGDA